MTNKKKIEETITDTIGSSELVRMAFKHFDEESTKEMVEELIEALKMNILKIIYTE